MDSKKKYRAKKLKPGELRVYYGVDHDGEGYDVVVQNGKGTGRADRSYLWSVLASERASRSFVGDGTITEPSVIDELMARGYDIETIEFRIKKKVILP